MALHELATNALKYGALSVAGGRVEIGWDCSPATQLFEIWWRESGGPAVRTPKRSGFGTTLIRDIPKRSLDGTVELDYPPEGVSWRLSLPAASLAGSFGVAA